MAVKVTQAVPVLVVAVVGALLALWTPLIEPLVKDYLPTVSFPLLRLASCALRKYCLYGMADHCA